MKAGCLPMLRSLRWAALAAAALVSGCLSAPKPREPATVTADRFIVAAEVYTLACPDSIEVVFAERPDYGWRAAVEADGTIRLGNLPPIHVEGDTTAEAAGRIAELCNRSPRQVLVKVVEYRSRQLFLFGEVNGGPRLVDYRGPETVLDLLGRTGGLAPDAAPEEVYVVRAQVGEGIPAEVLTVDLDAIRRGDQRTNVRVQPLDEIYVGEMERSRIGKAIPALLKPLYESLVELWPRRSSSQDDAKPTK